MSISYQADNEQILGIQLKVQSLRLPFSISGNASSASVAVGRDDPSIIFIKTQGVDQIAAALDAGDTAPTYAAANDAAGMFSILVKLYGEQIRKVVSAKIVCMDAGAPEIFACSLPSAPSSGIVQGGALDKMAFNADSSASFTSGSHNYSLEVSYVVNET